MALNTTAHERLAPDVNCIITYCTALYCLGKVYYTAWEPQLLLIVVKVLGGVRCTEEQKLKQEIISDSRSDQVFHWREGYPQTPGRKQLTQRGVV